MYIIEDNQKYKQETTVKRKIGIANTSTSYTIFAI